MEAIAVIATLAKLIKLAVDLGPDVIKAASDAKPFAEQIFKSLTGKKEITPEDLLELEAQIDELAAQLQVPLPPEA